MKRKSMTALIWLVILGTLLMMALGVMWSAVHRGGPGVGALEECPRLTELTAPDVGPWFYKEYGPDFQEIRLHFTLSDQFGDAEMPLLITRGTSGVWQVSVNFDAQPTPCIDQYKQLVEFSLGVLNEGERPFTYDNHESVTDYEAFLMSVYGYDLYLPLVGVGDE